MRLATVLLAASSGVDALSCAARPAAAPACCRSGLSSLRMLAGKARPARPTASTPAKVLPTDVTEVPAEAVAVATAPAVEAPPVPEGVDPIFPVNPPSLWQAHRVAGEAPSFQKVFGALRATEKEQMSEFVSVNRDLLDYRFFFKLTADQLLATNSGNAERAEELAALRVSSG